ncbi:hypothetical protein [Streptomyces triticirhizae]|uniref:Uncharacterized protein n=1 Tax=Streptomyces triticirhizae TaxID=2483353 RepID=A0A3M2LR11_9ACTN|nr:hypothetical protein [Streptomyces triticirhizae]RMI39732.1 hypothetical protein EBN88_14165 [Streptomyces triticirhizae]
MDITDISVTVDPAAGENWADLAEEAWLTAAREAGFAPAVTSWDVPNVAYDAALVDVDGASYVITSAGHVGTFRAVEVDA